MVGLISSSLLAATTFKIDPVHTSLMFKISHLGTSNVWGRINDAEGTITVDDDGLPSFSVEVKATNIDTANAMRDKDLRSPNYFDVKKYATLSFKSTSTKKIDDKTFEVVGDFTLMGKTKSITVTLTKVGEADTQMGHRMGFDTSFTIKRSDYGMDKMVGPIGDEVTIYVSLDSVRQ
jgi:polyisoprenoid-binding protein YceI